MYQVKSTIILVIIIFTICACSKSKDNSQVVFPKPTKETFDSIGTWLSQDSNYLTSKYLPLLETHFNEQIANNNIDSAAHLLIIAAGTAYRSYNFDTVIIQKQLALLSKYEHQLKPRFRSGLYYYLGGLFMKKREFEKSIFYYRKNNFTPEDYESEDYISWSYYGLMYNFLMTTQYDSSILYGQKAIVLFEKNKNRNGQIGVYVNLAGTYKYMQNYDESEKYTDKTLNLATELRDSERIFTTLYEKLFIHYESNSHLFYSSIDTLVQFEKKWQPNNPKFKLAAQSALAKKYLKDSNYIEAGKILRPLAPLLPLVKEEYYNFFYVSALGEYETANRQTLTLRNLYKERLENAKNNGELAEVINNSKILSEEAEVLNDYKTAYAYLKEMSNVQKDFTNEDARRNARELEKKYQTEKKEAQLKQQADDAIRKNIFIAFLLAGLAALFYLYYTVKKQKNIIAQQNELNEHTVTILSHDIKEPLLGVKLMLKKLNTNDPFVAQASQSLEGQINTVNSILNNLLRMKKLALTKKDKNAHANVQTVVNNVLQELYIPIQAKELTIQNELSEGLMLPIAPEKLQIIVHNLLSNAVKYSFPNQKIRIFKENKGFCIQDFGVGLSLEQRSKLMREVTASQQGTKQEPGNGLGLFLVGTMLQGENIKLVFDSPEVGGTIAKVMG